MPHELIYSLDADPDTPHRAQIAWGPPSSPSNTGPGHGNDDGHVMVIVERPDNPARMAASVEHTRARLLEILGDIEVDRALEQQDWGPTADALMAKHGGDLVYAFGGECTLLAVQLDRAGCNKLIAATRRGRDSAFGKDQ